MNSMTAFARMVCSGEWGQAVWELRAVNHRYLEVGFRLPDPVRELEHKLRESLNKQVTRGKIDIALKYEPSQESAASISLNWALIRELADQGQKVAQAIAHSAPINPFEIIRWPGVVMTEAADMQSVKDAIYQGFMEALQQFVMTRQREGKSLKLTLESRLSEARQVGVEIKKRLPDIISKQTQKLKNRFSELSAAIDVHRFEQEVVYHLQKLDIDEELERLNCHLNEVERVLAVSSSCGRRLDFLMQELNREVNTLSAKSVDADTTRLAIDLKVIIEQMREQIQNIE